MQAPQIRWYLFSKLKIQWGDGVCPVPQVLYRDRLGGTRFSHFRRLEFRPPKTSAEQQRENTFFRPVCLALSGGRDSSQDMNEFKFASATCASVARGPISKKSCSKSWGIGNGNRLASLSLRSQNHFARPMEHITSGKAFAGWISQPDLFVLTVSCFVSHTGLPSVFFYQSPALKVQSRKWLRCASSCEMTEK